MKKGLYLLQQFTIYSLFNAYSLMSTCIALSIYFLIRRNTLACFQMIKTITQACSISDIGIRFLARLPSPTYLFPNYLTWM